MAKFYGKNDANPQKENNLPEYEELDEDVEGQNDKQKKSEEYEDLDEDLEAEDFEQEELEEPEDPTKESFDDGEEEYEDLDVDSSDIADIYDESKEIPNNPEDEQDATKLDKGKLEEPEIDNSLSKIAIGNKSSFAIIGGFVLLVIFILYNTFSKQKEANQSTEPSPGIVAQQENASPADLSQADNLIKPQIPKLPGAPEMIAPVINNSTAQSGGDLPPPPVAGSATPSQTTNLSVPNQGQLQAGSTPPAVPVVPPSVDAHTADASNPSSPPKPAIAPIATLNKTNANKYKSSMSAYGGGGQGGDSKDSGASIYTLKRTTSGNQIGVSYIGDLNVIIAQGKIMDAVLETAISTDLQGPARAMVSRDVYAEAGKNVLIPKGSRLIGTYSSGATAGTIRVQVVWNRLIRPDGVDIAIASPGVDPLGKAGVAGQYDGRALALFSNAAMVSLVEFTMAILQDRQAKKDGTYGQTNVVVTNTGANTPSGTSPSNNSANSNGTLPNGVTNVNGNIAIQSKQPSAKSQALEETAQQMSSVTSQIGQNYYGSATTPRIIVDQGTKLKVFIQKDIVFAGDAANQSGVIK